MPDPTIYTKAKVLAGVLTAANSFLSKDDYSALRKDNLVFTISSYNALTSINVLRSVEPGRSANFADFYKNVYLDELLKNNEIKEQDCQKAGEIVDILVEIDKLKILGNPLKKGAEEAYLPHLIPFTEKIVELLPKEPYPFKSKDGYTTKDAVVINMLAMYDAVAGLAEFFKHSTMLGINGKKIARRYEDFLWMNFYSNKVRIADKKNMAETIAVICLRSSPENPGLSFDKELLEQDDKKEVEIFKGLRTMFMRERGMKEEEIKRVLPIEVNSWKRLEKGMLGYSFLDRIFKRSDVKLAENVRDRSYRNLCIENEKMNEKNKDSESGSSRSYGFESLKERQEKEIKGFMETSERVIMNVEKIIEMIKNK